jgi:hypothetical protein
MAEIGQLCNIESDQDTVYRIIAVKPDKMNGSSIREGVQTILKNFFVDVEEVKNPSVQKLNIPIYNVHIIKDK